MGVIIKESGRVRRIVEEVVDLRGIERGRMVVKKEKVDIVGEFEERVYMVKERGVKEGKDLVYEEGMEGMYGAV